MTKNKKHLQQFIKAKAGIQLLYNEASFITEYEELERLLATFAKYILQTANKNNQVANKHIIAFKRYYDNEADKPRSIQRVEKQAKGKRLSYQTSYKDYTQEYLLLRKRGYSWRMIAVYSQKHFKVKVSKDTLRTYIGGLEQ